MPNSAAVRTILARFTCECMSGHASISSRRVARDCGALWRCCVSVVSDRIMNNIFRKGEQQQQQQQVNRGVNNTTSHCPSTNRQKKVPSGPHGAQTCVW